MKIKLSFISIVFIVVLFSNKVFAQQNSTMFLLHDIPQTNLLNPAVQIQCKWFVGIPVLSSVHLNYSNTTFSFNDLFTTSSDTSRINIQSFYDKIKNTNLAGVDAHINLISIGYQLNEYYINFNVTEKVNVAATYPGSLIELAWKGNTQFLGETEKFNNLRTHTVHYREYALGVSKVWDAYNILGLRAKLLFGKGNVYSSKSKLSLYTNPTTFDLEIEGDIRVNSSYPLTIEQDADGNISGVTVGSVDPLSYLMNSKNKGLALDLGWIHKHSDNMNLSASILDLGFIRWKSDVNNVHLSGSFHYTGANYGNLDYLEELGDSILQSFNQSVTQEKYYSWLPTQVYLGGMYQYKPKLGIGLVNRNVIYRGKLHSSITLSANTKLWDKFSGSLSWSYLNNTYKNVGLALAWHSRGLQFHLVSDNILGMIKPLDTRNLNLRFGLGVMFGCPKNKEEKLKMSNEFNPMNKGNCFWAKKMNKEHKKVLKKKKKREKK